MGKAWQPLRGEGNITDSIRYQADGEIIGVLVEDDYYCHEVLPDNIRMFELVDVPDAPSVDEIMQVLNGEILWCEQNPDKAFHAEYRKGFINGLIQAKYLITELKGATE